MPNKPDPVRLTFSARSFSLFALASVASLPLLNLRGAFSDVQLLFGIGLAVTALTGFMIALLDALTRPARLRLEILANNQFMLGLIALIGLTRGYFSFLALNLLDFPKLANLPTRLATSTTTTLLWLTLAIYLVSMQAEFKSRCEAFLRNSFAGLSKVKTSKLRKIPSSLAPEIEAIEAQIQKSLSRTFEPLVSRELLISASEQLRDCIEASIRPLSHRLWVQAEKVYPQISLWGLVKEALNRQDFSVVSAVSFMALLNSVNLTSVIGFPRALLTTVLILFVSSAYFVCQRRFFPQIENQSVALKLLNLSTPGLLLSVVFYLINKYLFIDDFGFYGFIFLPVCFSVFLIASIISVLRYEQDSLFIRLQSNMSKRLNNLETHQDLEAGKQVAAFLHNSVQSELLALSYQLEELASHPESDQTRATLERLASSLNAQIGKNFEDFNEKPVERVKKLKSGWAGITELEFRFDFSLLATFEYAHNVVQVIEEAITNAVRSAGATYIEISWHQLTGGQFTLSITDNGERNQTEVAGLGTQWLNDIALGRWSRSQMNGHTNLLVNFET